MVAAEQIQEEKLIALARQIDLLQVEFARQAASYAASRRFEVDGFTSPMAKWSAAHHLRHWAQDGPTDLDNLVLLCHRHHKLVHKGGWQLVESEGGALLTIPPRIRFDRFARGPD